MLAVAIAGTVAVACGAFWLSFTTLRDLAVRSGIGTGQAWVWPLIVDGVIVVATVSAVALDGAGRGRRAYAWLLLGAGAAISVCANALHAIVAGGVRVPVTLAAVVASVPPVVLLAITHLTVLLTRPGTGEAPDRTGTAARLDSSPTPPAVSRPVPVRRALPAAAPAAGDGEPRMMALRWRREGLSTQQIADRLGVHRTTISRWLSIGPAGVPELSGTPSPDSTPHEQEDL